ncbi:hypothetical protein [Psychrobacillus sp. FSL H8-0510]|uniref:hypothetical protein n=1 Tax=Psychrobacillus sp. FSL H8-0510 TaxID=2921394 RepID=UPI0030F8EA5D
MKYKDNFYNTMQERLKGSEPFFKQQILELLNSINSNMDVFTNNDPETYLKQLLQDISELQDERNAIVTIPLIVEGEKELKLLQPGSAFLNTSFVITGAAGTGKSYRLINFAKKLMQQEKSVVFLTQELSTKAKENLLVFAETTDYLIIDEAYLVLRDNLQPELIKSLLQRTNLILSTHSIESLELLPGFDLRQFNYHLHLGNKEEIIINTPEFHTISGK